MSDGDEVQQDEEPDEEDRRHDEHEFESRVADYMNDAAFVEAVKRAGGVAYDVSLCVDAEILAELERKWDRNNPINAFGVYESLKAENPKVWVSPEVSLRMLSSVEYTARTALNEATRA